MVQKYISKTGWRFYGLYVDLQKAFDSFVHLNMFNSMKNKCVCAKIITYSCIYVF